MKVLTKQKCTTCQGRGKLTVSQKVWADYESAEKDFLEKHGSIMPDDVFYKWWAERNNSEPKDEKSTCKDCLGTGAKEIWMDTEE